MIYGFVIQTPMKKMIISIEANAGLLILYKKKKHEFFTLALRYYGLSQGIAIDYDTVLFIFFLPNLFYYFTFIIPN
jgi:RNase adaptor protein for sRNA GlmZ degradation